jgi:uncharacterized protein
MIVTGEHLFPGPRDAVWALLHDPAVLRRAMPGCRELVRTGEFVYEGALRVGVGPVTAAEWALRVELTERVPPESYRMMIDGHGTLGFTRGSATVRLEEAPDGATRMLYAADLQVGGRVAGVGQRLLDQVSRLLTRQGLDALARDLDARLADEAAP